ncbi:MAG: hypothetical protein FWC19_09400 [Treponema sp.]|nr:hypothetical protein [Treponema sp.]MCL2272999.1 hypothetical protein [Treponema sp.]
MGKYLSAYLKPILALIISIFIFTGIAFLAGRYLSKFFQTRFYNHSVVNSYIKENAGDAEILQMYILELQNKFALTLEEPAVRNSFHYDQNHDDIIKRSGIYGILVKTTKGLQSVRFIDKNGIGIYYSTLARDILNQSSDSVSYRDYTEDTSALPYNTISVSSNGEPKYTMDGKGECIIYSFPFADSMNIYTGTAVFSVSASALAEKLISAGRLKADENVSVISSPPGVLFGSPDSFKKDIFQNISMIWNEGKQGRIILDAEDSGMKYSLISAKTGHDLFIGRLVNDSLFSISSSMRIIFYLSMFLTFYLALFFLINFKPNPVTAVQSRLTHFRDNIFEQLYVNKDSQDRAKWIFELEQRRDEICSELKGNLKLNRHSEETIDGIIDRSWDQLLAVIKTGNDTFDAKAETGKQEEAEENIEEIDQAGPIEEMEEAETLEEIGETGEIGEVDELEELAEIEEEGISESDIEMVKSIKPPLNTGRPSGLLRLAMKIVEEKTKTAEMEISIADSSAVKESVFNVRKSLHALASDIEFNNEAPALPESEEESPADAELDIVSPFASMFSELDKKKPSERKKKPAAVKKKAAPKEKKQAPAKKKTASKEKKPAVKNKKPAAAKKKTAPAEKKPAAKKKKSAPKKDTPAAEEKKPARKRSIKKDQ